MTSTVSSYSPTETVVTFLTGTDSTDPTKRVFDFEISQASATLYANLMTTLQYACNGQRWDESTSSWVDIGDTTQQMSIIQTVLRTLDSWSQMKYIDSNSIQQEQTRSLTTSDLPYALKDITGATSPYTPDTTMNRYMAESVDKIIRTFRVAGWDPITVDSSNAAAAAALDTLLNSYYTDSSTGNQVSVYDFESVLSAALAVVQSAVISTDAFTQSQSIQQLLMVDYIARGNELLYNQMETLQDAINTNQSILSYINCLQDLMNQKDPQHFLMQLQLLNSSSPDYAEFEKETYNQELGNTSKFTDEDIAAYIQILHNQALGLDTDTTVTSTSDTGEAAGAFTVIEADGTVSTISIDTISNTFNGTTGLLQIETNLQTLIDLAEAKGGSEASGLVSSLRQVLNDFKGIGSVEEWVTDYGTGSEGDFQQHLNDATVASQSFNDTEREQLQQVMFVYEEFYKSATEMLSNLSQIIVKMASAISR